MAETAIQHPQLFLRKSQSFKQGSMLWSRSVTHCVLPLLSRFQEKFKELGQLLFSDVEPIPTSDVQDLAAWLSQRNCEFAQCNRERGPSVRGKVGCLVGQGCSQQLDTISQTTSDHGQHQTKDCSHNIDESIRTRVMLFERRVWGRQVTQVLLDRGFAVPPVCPRRLWTILKPL